MISNKQATRAHARKDFSGIPTNIRRSRRPARSAQNPLRPNKLTEKSNQLLNRANTFLSKRAQVTIFIIVAIIIVAVAAGFFIFKDKFVSSSIPASMEPVYNSFLNCLEEKTLTGISVLESSAGYIELPDFEVGSNYMPFGSQLDFLGNPVPYWYYVSGNNVQKEQVPSLRDMEEQLGNFIEDNIRNCEFDVYNEQGFAVLMEEPDAVVDIQGDEVVVNLDMKFGIEKADESVFVSDHSVNVDSKLGELYDSAREIYSKEQDELFLENYAVDTLRLYAPVDGVELTCAPLTWVADEVFTDLQEAIEVNTLALRTKGGDYSLNKKENKYFVVDTDAYARFINSKDWAFSFEVLPDEDGVLISKPIGNQPGLGILGFCYVPYHFVYNVKYPVLVQVYSGEEIFQFPVAVVLQGNNPREPLDTLASDVEDFGICEDKNTLIEVKTYDSNLNSIDAEVSSECFGSVCEIGNTVDGRLVEKFPQCVNGYVLAKAEGYEDARTLFSTVEEGSVSVILDRLYEMNVELKLDGKDYSGNAIISFNSDAGSKTIVYPEQKSVELAEGQYEIQVSVYRDSSLKIESSVREQCMEVPRSGVGALFGLTEEKCFEYEIPEQIVSNALAGGGTENYYVLESELRNSNTLKINADSLKTPTTIEELQTNYVAFESQELGVSFK